METTASLYERLHAAGVLPTLQRLAIGEVLLARPVHMTAEQVLAAARERLAASRAPRCTARCRLSCGTGCCASC